MDRPGLAAARLAMLALAVGQSPSLPSDEALRRNNLGVALMDEGTKDPKYMGEAVREFEAALARSPEYQTSRLNLGIALYYAGDTERSAATLERVLHDRPSDPRAHFVLGLVREYAGEFEAAAAHFQQVATQDSGDADAWYHLGFSLGKANRADEAVAAFRRAAVIAPYQRRIRYGLFTALTRAGRAAEAQTELEAFRGLGTSQIRVVEGPKNTLEYLKQGRYAEAVADSRATAPSPPAPRYADVTQQAGIGMGARRPASPGAAGGVSAAFVDFNNDARLDVYVLFAGRQRLFAQQASGQFIEVPALPPAGRAVAAVWGDLDNDGWTDLVLAEPDRLLLFINQHGRRLVLATRGALAFPAIRRAGGLALADVDHDGDLDIAVASETNMLFRNNSNGTFTELGREAGFTARGFSANTLWFGDINDDRAVDAVLVDASGNQQVLLNRKDGTFASTANVPVPALGTTRFDEARAYGDFNGDGAIDELVVGPDGLRLLRNDARPSHWLTVRPVGYAVPGKVKSNRLGIGTKLEVRAPGFWQRREVRAGNGMGGTDAAEITFDLGSEPRPDFVRAIFPSGVRRTQRAVASNRAVTLEEPLLDVNSCPTLFAWNGARFEFVTDTLSAGVLGELVAPGQFLQPDADEWVRIEGRQLTADRHGRLAVRFTNPLEEVTYLDAARLVAVDHPRDQPVYTDERMTNVPHPARAVRLMAVARQRPLVRATDQDGHDVSALLASADRHSFDHFTPRPFKGFAGDWALTLELGPVAPHSWPVLGLEGWSYWNSSAAIVAATQAREQLWGPVLEVQDQSGHWRTATDDLGVHAGLPRVMLIDLRPYLRPGEHAVRIRTNRTLYYDRIWVGDAVDARAIESDVQSASFTVTPVGLTDARLEWLGYPHRRLPDGNLPEVFDYEDIRQESDWGTHAGLLTRYGDVRSLLTAADNRFVVMEHGEEVALDFDGTALPPLPPGWSRTFFFYANGFEKGYEINSAYAETVEPLPRQRTGASHYDPFDSPLDMGFAEYELEWNTRPAFLKALR